MFNKLKNIFVKKDDIDTDKSSVVSKKVKNSTDKIADQPIKKKTVKKSTSSTKKSKSKPESAPILSEKDRATLAEEPYVTITKVNVDPHNINSGSFELDFNDKFVINLIKTGYKIREDDTDVQIVDRWFQTVCRNIALEFYEQQAADPTKREADDIRSVSKKDLGNGRSEIS